MEISMAKGMISLGETPSYYSFVARVVWLCLGYGQGRWISLEG